MQDHVSAVDPRAKDRLRWWAQAAFNSDTTRLREWFSWIGDRRDHPFHLVEQNQMLPSADIGQPWADELLSLDAFSHEGSKARLAFEGHFSEAVAPFLSRSRDRIKPALEALQAAGVEVDLEPVVAWFLRTLEARLVSLAHPSLTMAFKIAEIQGRLKGQTFTERMRSFAGLMAEPNERRQALSRTPVLDRLLAQVSINACAAFTEILAHLTEDRAAIAEAFNLTTFRLEAVVTELGDSHQGGRTVARLKISGVDLVYKPRSLATDIAFNTLCDWLSEQIDAEVPTLKTLSMEDHGWAAFAAPAECQDPEAVENCYRRLGYLLCLLYVLGGCDIHYENIVCSADRPYVVDLETLFSPWPALRYRALSTQARTALETVLRIGVLPRPTALGDTVVDLSAAGVRPEQRGPSVAVADWADAADVRYITRNFEIPIGESNPRMGGKPANAYNHVDSLITGFTQAYRAVARGKPALLAADGLLSTMRQVPYRWIARPTAQYGDILRASLHPESLRDAIDREVAFSRLERQLFRKAAHRRLLTRSEIDDLWDCDIPVFKAVADGTSICDSRGRRIEKVFRKSGYETLRARVKRLSQADLERQTYLIRQSFSLPQPQRVAPPSRRPSGSVVSASVADTAVDLAHRIADVAFSADGTLQWDDIRLLGETRTLSQVGEPWLYGGSAGIGIFLAEAARFSDDAGLKRQASRILRALRRGYGALEAGIGAFDGVAGLLFAELRIGAALDDIDHRSALRRLEKIRAGAASDRAFDIISGSAGACLVALQAADHPALASRALDAAQACASRLEVLAVGQSAGVAWPVPRFKTPLTGFAHGAAGAALALAAASKALGRREWADLAWEALRYEAQSFDETSGQWRDLRVEGEAVHTAAWCHGAPGMTLARLLIQELELDSQPDWLQAQIDRGLTATRDSMDMAGDNLCHGRLGNLEPLLRRSDTRPLALARIDDICREGARAGWKSDFSAISPSLMTGLSGIGLALLRSAEPTIGSVLSLELSRCSAALGAPSVAPDGRAKAC